MWAVRQAAEAPLRCAPPQARTARRVVVFSAPKQEQIEAAIKVRGSGAREPLASPPRRWGRAARAIAIAGRRRLPRALRRAGSAPRPRALAGRAVQPCLRPPPPPPPERHTCSAGPLHGRLAAPLPQFSCSTPPACLLQEAEETCAGGPSGEW